MSKAHSDETKAKLKVLWDEGMGARQIAEALGLPSRNAVIGLAGRMKLTPRGSEGPWRIEGQARKRKSQMDALFNPVPRMPVSKPPKAPETVLDIPPPIGPIGDYPAAGGCRWITGETGRNFQCCGHPKAHSGPYCEAHANIAYPNKGQKHGRR